MNISSDTGLLYPGDILASRCVMEAGHEATAQGLSSHQVSCDWRRDNTISPVIGPGDVRLLPLLLHAGRGHPQQRRGPAVHQPGPARGVLGQHGPRKHPGAIVSTGTTL